MEKTPAVSVIIPVYNAEKYLEKCLLSVCGQTLKDIEIICVNDGSSDSSKGLLLQFASEDKRIRVISQENAGPGAARNRGMAAACGEYFAFIDADDYWEPHLLETAYAQAGKYDSDICFYSYAVFDEVTGKISKPPYEAWLPHKIVFKPDDYPNDLFQMTTAGPGFRLYKRSLILENDLQFLPQHIAEDMYFVYLSLAFAAKITYIRGVFVYIRRGISENLSSSLEKYPYETHHSLLMIKKRLEEAGLYQTFHKTFRTAAIASSEYVFWHISPDFLPMDERARMLAELDIADKNSISEYHRPDEPQGKIKTLQRMLRVYGVSYTVRYYTQMLHRGS